MGSCPGRVLSRWGNCPGGSSPGGVLSCMVGCCPDGELS